MAHIVIPHVPEREEKLALMQEMAQFDVSDQDDACLPDLSAIRRDITVRGGGLTAPKVGLSNECVFNCAYCACRCGREDRIPCSMQPRELAGIALETAQQNHNAVFITSAIYKNADYTEELIIETMRILRDELGYTGYLHAKVMPGADPELIRRAGRYADRMSVNIEVACSEGYQRIAKNKNKSNILTPMGYISRFIREAADGPAGRRPRFATSQTTQLMAGSTGEDDFTILNLAQALYRKYGLKRVYYTAFQYQRPARGYEELPLVSTPGWRMRRLYQADRLMQLYGFTPQEIAPSAQTFLEEDLDPKAAWALRHPDLYPVEVNKADLDTLLRIPGIGLVYAQRILKARRYCTITHDVLRALGVSLKRSRHFLLCNGRYEGNKRRDPETLRGLLTLPADTAAGNSVEDGGPECETVGT